MWGHPTRALGLAAMLGYADIARGVSRNFYAQCRTVNGSHGHFDFPVSGDHGRLGILGAIIGCPVRRHIVCGQARNEMQCSTT
jgi:hypothetical protein